MDKDKKYCINCGKVIPKTATFCPYCSAWQEDSLPAPESTEENGKADKENDGGNENTERSRGYTEDEESPLEGTYVLGSREKDSRDIEKKKFDKKEMAGTTAAGDDRDRIKELEEKAYRDALTHLYNRQKLQEVKNGLNENLACALISIDINDLKHTNDTYGHDKGDQLIGNMARVLRQLEPDNSYRTGGDEFLVLLPGGTKDSAGKLAQNIRSMLDELRENPDNGFVPVAALGIAEKKPGETFDQAVKVADEQMYEDKKRIKGKRGRRSTDRILEVRKQDSAEADGINRQHTSESITEGVRRSEEKRAEREMKERYMAKKAAYQKMVTGRSAETVFFGVILVVIFVIRARIG